MFTLLTILTLCLDSTLTLCSPAIDDTLFYVWSTGAQTSCIDITGTAVGEAEYICEARTKTFITTDNLMANGDFENYTDYHQQPTGYTSDYEYLPFDPYGTDLYDQPQYQGKSGVYLLSHNAKHTWRDYANVSPHSGNLFAMFDAAHSGYFFAGKNGKTRYLGKDNLWHYSQTFWTSPVTSDSIEIGVEDLNDYYGVGNDFGLDDIIFQMVTLEDSKLIDTDTFRVITEDCTPCLDFVYRKWNDVLFADNTDEQFVSYQWYEDSVAVAGATAQFYQLTDTVTPHFYYVEATMTDGRIRTSCVQLFEQFTPSASQTPAKSNRLVLHQGRLLIQTKNTFYDLLGNELTAPSR